MVGPLITSLSQQLEKAATMDEVMEAADAELRIDRDKMYTDALPCDSPLITLNPHLNEREIEDARWWYKYLDHEVILLHGPLGEGKGTVGNKILKMANWYYGKNVFLDYQPRELFDLQFKPSYYDEQYNNPHDPVLLKHAMYNPFNKVSFIEQIARMADVSLGALANDADPELEKIEKTKAMEVRRLSGVWVSQKGRVWLQNAIMGLDEIKRYHFKLRQNDPFGVMLVYLYDLLRHMHLCVLGMTAYYNELDPNRFLPKVTVEIKCHKSEYNFHTHFGDVYKAQWNSARETRNLRKLKTLVVDGREPWPLLGNYVYGELVQDVDKGVLNTGTGLRTSDCLLLKDTKGFRDENGVAWLENEYIGYALRTDAGGYTYQKGVKANNLGIPNALIGVTRRMNWRVNHCEPAEHKAGAVVFTGLGVYDIYDSENPFDLPVAKSMRK